MAVQQNHFIPMLILAIFIASAMASTLTRDPKELLFFPHSYSPFYRTPSMQSRFGPTQRQTSSPINPMIGQQGLGPFFGYFPNLLTQPCPACAECKNCSICEVCPVVPETPPPGEIKTCGQRLEAILSAAPNGTIKMDIPPAVGGVTLCEIALMAYYPKTRVQLNCGSISSTTTMSVIPLTSPVTVAVAKTDYVSKDQVLFVGFHNSLDATKNVVADCTWTNVPA